MKLMAPELCTIVRQVQRLEQSRSKVVIPLLGTSQQNKSHQKSGFYMNTPQYFIHLTFEVQLKTDAFLQSQASLGSSTWLEQKKQILSENYNFIKK